MITKAHQIVLIKSCLIGLLLLVSCCQDKSNVPLADLTNEQLADELILKPIEGKWYHDNRPFNGIALDYYDDGTLLSSIAYVAGKKQGQAHWWFDSGQEQKKAFYRANRLHGTVMTWWPNGLKSSESSYEMGVLNGIQKRWHSNGQLARKTQLVAGKEEGIQQAWLANGKLYVNYQAKNGRIFGLKKSVLCYELENEIVQN